MAKLNDISQEARQAEIDKLFAESGEIEVFVDLPSKGKFYNNFNGCKVTILLFEDEQRILTSKNKGSNLVNDIIAKCVTGVNVNDLLAMDKLAILLKIKEISYGNELKFTTTCPACSEDTKVSINVSEIPVNEVPDDLEDPREIFLPVLKVKAKVRFPRNHEEFYFNDTETAINNLYRFIVEIDGKEDPVFISKVFKKLHIRDNKTIVKEIHRSDLGLDPTFKFECPKCGHSSSMGVPLDANFFSVS
jgi:transcription elongation factor Elf1